MITKIYVVDRYEELIAECQAKHGNWVVSPAHLVFFKRRALGCAYSNGVVGINEAFIGSTDYKSLDDTLRHELAHLAAGLEANHGPVWKRMAVLFGARPATCGTVADEIRDQLFKYYLLAHMESGKVLHCKPMNRKMSRYTQYKGGFNIKSEKITRFEYVSFKKGIELIDSNSVG